MKILIREYQGEQFVWEQAKYNGKRFVVRNNEEINEDNVVSILNDNRKNYVKCSSCGELVPKNGNAFAKHKAESCGINPCIGCRKFKVDYMGSPKSQYIKNADGTYTQKSKGNVKLLCNYQTYKNAPLDHPEVIARCSKRQCANAHGKEIVDTFTTYPGLFDEILTVDKLLDDENVTRAYYGDRWSEYRLSQEIDLRALVNGLGIIDRFYYDIEFESNTIYYSKKYKKLFVYDCSGECSKYTEFTENSSNYYEEIKQCIERLYK
jgi:hypothetical protein